MASITLANFCLLSTPLMNFLSFCNFHPNNFLFLVFFFLTILTPQVEGVWSHLEEMAASSPPDAELYNISLKVGEGYNMIHLIRQHFLRLASLRVAFWDAVLQTPGLGFVCFLLFNVHASKCLHRIDSGFLFCFDSLLSVLSTRRYFFKPVFKRVYSRLGLIFPIYSPPPPAWTKRCVSQWN